MKRSLLMACLAAGTLMASAGFAEEKAEEKELASSLALGVTVNDGNSDNSMYNASLTLDYKPDDNTVTRFAADWAYGETEDDKTTDNGKASADYKHLFSERTYASVNASAAYDDIADLDYRWVLSPGYGVYLIKKDNVYLNTEAGPAVIGQKKGGVKEENFALRVAERYERVQENGSKYWQSLEYLPFIDDFGTYVLNAEIGVEAPLSQKVNLRLVVKDTYDSNPAPGRDENDLTIIGALAFTLL